MATKELPETESAICAGGCPKNGSSTYYVHLNNGQIVTVAGVADVKLTDEEIVFCGRGEAVARYRRSAVYFACCQETAPVPQC